MEGKMFDYRLYRLPENGIRIRDEILTAIKY